MTEPVSSRHLAAMSAALRPVLDGDRRRARVLAAFPRAVYLEVEQPEVEQSEVGRSEVGQSEIGQLELEQPRGSTRPLVASVVTADGLVHPNSAVLVEASVERPLSPCRAGMSVRIGRGRIELGALVVTVARWWDPRPILPPIDAAGLGDRVSVVEQLLAVDAADPPPLLADAATAVASALAESALGASASGTPDRGGHARGDHARGGHARGGHARGGHDLGGPDLRVVAAGRGLVGLGPGLTPSGDDVLCGLFAGAILLGRSLAKHAARRGDDDHAALISERVDAVMCAAGRIAAAAHGRTTTLSEALLWHAARGEVSGPLLGVLQSSTGAAPLGPSLERLLAVGSTSGRDLALGVTAGARLAATLSSAPSPARDRPVAPSVRGGALAWSARDRAAAPPASVAAGSPFAVDSPFAAVDAPFATAGSPFAVPSVSRSRP